MEINRFNITYKSRGYDEKIHLIPVGDVHLGNPGCDLDFFKNLIKWMSNKDNTYMIGMGDYIEATHPQMPWFDLDAIQKMTLDNRQDLINRNAITMRKQMDEFKKIIKPIADQERIILLHSGNHDSRLEPMTGYNMVAEMCVEFGCKYGGHSAFTRLNFSRKNRRGPSWDIFSTHGRFRGTTAGGKLTKLEKLVNMFQADIYLHGDAHDLVSYEYPVLRLNDSNNLEEAVKILSHTGSFVKSYVEGYGTYSEKKDYKPVKIGCPKITFIPEKKIIKLTKYSTDGWQEWDKQ